MSILIIDFSEMNAKQTLYTGRKNGIRARETYFTKIDSEDVDLIVFKAEKNQLITSSYFLGLLGNIPSRFTDMSEALEHISLDGLGEKTKSECKRALQRFLDSSKPNY